MSAYAKIAAETGDRYLAALAATQENILEFVTASQKMAPTLPAFPPASTAAAGAKSFIHASYDFASKMLEQQEQFVVKFLGDQEPKQAATAKRASSSAASAKPAATKTAAKKKAAPRKAPAKAATSGQAATKSASPPSASTQK